MSSFTPRDNSLAAKSLALSRLRATDMQALQRAGAEQGHSIRTTLGCQRRRSPMFQFRSRERIRRHRIGRRSSISVGSRSLDDRAIPPVVLVDRKIVELWRGRPLAGLSGQSGSRPGPANSGDEPDFQDILLCAADACVR